MAISKDLLLAILSMDAYNQGYSPGLVHGKSQIGTATISNRSSSLANSPEVAAGFYAVAYQWNGDTIMASRPRRPWRRPW